MTIREAREADADSAMDVVRRSIEQSCVADHRNDPATLARWLGNKTAPSFRGWIANPDNFCVVAEAAGGLSGVGLLHRSGEFKLFYLRPDAQRQGAGTAIYRALERKAREWGLRRLYLSSTAAARPFYEAMDFRPAGPAARLFGVLQAFPYERNL